MKGIRALFGGLVEKHRLTRERDRSYSDALAAIEKRDLEALQKNLAPSFTSRQTCELFDKAIASDDVNIFSTVLNKLGDGNPNVIFYSHYFDDVNFTQISLLHRAISTGKPAVALALASDPTTNITFSGIVARTIARNKQGGEAIQEPMTASPLVLAREEGMHAVVSVLAQRTVELKLVEIAMLKEEVTGLEANGFAAKPAPKILKAA